MQKISDQLIHCRENISRFHTVNVFMVTFPAFVVVTDHADPSPAEIEPIFVTVQASQNRGRQAPDHHLDDRAIGKNSLLVKQFLSLHVGMIANNPYFVKHDHSGRRPCLLSKNR